MTTPALLPFVDPVTDVAWLDRTDLDTVMGAKKVDELSNDDGTGRVNLTKLYAIMAKAEQKVVSILLRAYTPDEIVEIMNNDPLCRAYSADIASEYLSRKPPFMAADGTGAHMAAMKEALEHFEKMSHGRTANPTPAVSNAQEGGRQRPPVVYPEQPFIFAPDTRARFPGRGGF